jgi:hypothetical protein
MNHRSLIVSIVLITIVLSLTLLGSQFVSPVKANFKPNPFPYAKPITTIVTPQNGQDFSALDVTLKVQVKLYGIMDDYGNSKVESILWLNYSLDSQKPVPLKVTYTYKSFDYPFYANGETTLHGLSKGTHNIFLLGSTSYGSTIYDRVNFTTNSTLNYPLPSTEISPSPTETVSPSPPPSPSQTPLEYPTIEPTSKPQQNGFFGSTLTLEYTILAVTVALLVAVCLLVYSKRVRKRGQ